MNLSEKAEKYAKEHPQMVNISWIDNSVRTYSADKAIRLCSVPRIRPCLMGAECADKTLEGMLNQLIDGE